MHHRPLDESISTLRVGAILAGGRSRRFGAPKQLATVGGIQLVERVAGALRSAGVTAVAITAPEGPDLSHLLPCRADVRPGLGPLGGLHTALQWARELGLRGALCVACDMPLLAPRLLRRLVDLGERLPDAVVAPESGGPRGIEPLCAWYPISALGEIERRLDDAELSLAGLLAALEVRRLAIAEVSALGDPDLFFHNVNTPEEGEAAEAMLTRREVRDGGR